MPLPGKPEVIASDPDLPHSRRLFPAVIPVAEAGLLIDGQVDARETAATIIDLAVRGALRVESSVTTTSGSPCSTQSWRVRRTRWCC